MNTEKIGKVLSLLSSKAKDILADYQIRHLIDEAFSEKASTRVLARAKLKKEHPEVWAELDLGR